MVIDIFNRLAILTRIEASEMSQKPCMCVSIEKTAASADNGCDEGGRNDEGLMIFDGHITRTIYTKPDGKPQYKNTHTHTHRHNKV